MLLERSSGILLHPTSLPNGTLDEHAYRFVDWLAAAGQSWWQVLPLGPPEGITGSPYMSPSAFAGSPALLARPGARVTRDEARAFHDKHFYWTADWDGSLEDQVRFEREWQPCACMRGSVACASSATCRSTSPTTAPTTARTRGSFRRAPVAGVPPDAFTATGQLWGNPLYDWTAMRADGYRWWIERFRRTFELVDLTRLDHFRGFVSYWAVARRQPDRRARALAPRAGRGTLPRDPKRSSAR